MSSESFQDDKSEKFFALHRLNRNLHSNWEQSKFLKAGQIFQLSSDLF